MKKQKIGTYALCVGTGILLYLLAELSSGGGKRGPESGILKRRQTGQGGEVYQIFIDGLEEEETFVTVEVPEQKISGVQLKEILSQAAELLCERIQGENESLRTVSHDLELCTGLPEYGLSVSWESEDVNVIGSTGIVNSEQVPPEGKNVYLRAELSSGTAKEVIEIPVTVVPEETTVSERFLTFLLALLEREPEKPEVQLPREFEGKVLSYREKREAGNEILIVLGVLAAVCLSQKEKSEAGRQKKKREDSLLLDYPEMLSRFIVLTGAGYPIKQAFKRLSEDSAKAKKPGFHPLYEEMQIALNQMETGTPEMKAYGDFGRRCGLRCYMRFASLITSSLQTGGRNTRKLLEEEMEEAFKQRKDLARRRGEEASTKLLLPMFLILGTVMIMVVAPAFLTLG